MRYSVLGLAAAAAFAAAGTAQAASTSAASPTDSSQASSASMAHMNVRQQLQDSLSRDGFSNVTIMPSSFFVRATNKQGQPVAMVVSPDSVTEVTEIPTGGSQHTAGMPDNGKPASTASKQ